MNELTQQHTKEMIVTNMRALHIALLHLYLDRREFIIIIIRLAIVTNLKLCGAIYEAAEMRAQEISENRTLLKNLDS